MPRIDAEEAGCPNVVRLAGAKGITPSFIVRPDL
jgi:hypothetical protein